MKVCGYRYGNYTEYVEASVEPEDFRDAIKIWINSRKDSLKSETISITDAARLLRSHILYSKVIDILYEEGEVYDTDYDNNETELNSDGGDFDEFDEDIQQIIEEELDKFSKGRDKALGEL